MDLSSLNSEQLKAVTHINGPMLVLAGAGSGKTKVLTNRIAYLIENGVNPSNILAITFTNKASKEMRDRVIKLVGTSAYDIQLSTFHSFGLRILKENYHYLGYQKNFTILDSDDTLTIIKKIMKEIDLNPKFYNAKDIRNKISSAKNELMTLEKFKKVEFDNNIILVYQRYLKKLQTNNSLDFDDLLILPIKLFKEHLSVLDYYRDKFKYILIDEYQDTNEAQYVLSKLLVGSDQNIFVVGDNDQAIYAFRGANYKNILNFEKDYPNAKVIFLEENYRSTKNILNAANSVIKHNKQRKDKNLWSNNPEGDKVKYVRLETDKDECSYISDKIKNLVNNGTSYEDIAILYRTNAQSRILEEEMLKNGIPYRVVGSFYFYNRKEIKDLICYLRLINNTSDDISLLRTINTPKRGIGDKTIDNLTSLANEQNKPMFDIIDKGKELAFKNIILDMIKESDKLTLTEIVDMVLDKSGIREELKKENSLDSEIRLENLEEFKSITKNYEEEYGIVSLSDFLEEISLVSDMSEHEDSTNRVNLMTIHSVKGLEFDNVFIVGMEEGIFPHYNSINSGSNSEIEEERRLCYVAITRAKKRLWITNAKRRMLFGNTQINMPSRFMDEIDYKYVETENNRENIISKVTKFIKKEDMYNKKSEDYHVGDHIHHQEFGTGVLVSLDGVLATIAFPHPYGVKKMIITHKSLSKVAE